VLVAERLLRALTVLLVLSVAGLAFVVSFEAISAFAVTTGAFPPALGWCAPLLVDTFTAAASLVVWSRSRAGLGARYARSLVAAATMVSRRSTSPTPPTAWWHGWWRRCRRWRCWPRLS
jgi:hypothetical protein